MKLKPHIEEFIQLHRFGLTPEQIASRTGYAESSVIKALKRYDYEPNCSKEKRHGA